MQMYAAFRPATPAAVTTTAPSRVRMELPGTPEAALAVGMGGAVGRGNMPAPLVSP